MVSIVKDGMTWIEAIIMHPAINLNTQPTRVPGPGMYLAWHEELWRQEEGE